MKIESKMKMKKKNGKTQPEYYAADQTWAAEKC